MSRPSALFLTHTVPLPAISGERVRSFNLMRQLAERGWRVSLFALEHGPAPGPADRERLEAMCDDVLRCRLDDTGRSRRLARALLRREAFESRLFLDENARTRLAAWLGERDVDVLVPGQLYMYPYVPRERLGTTVLDTHNAEAQRVASIAAARPATARGLIARLQRRAVARFEGEACASVARVLAVAPAERDYFEALAPGRVDLVPNGVDCESHVVRTEVPSAPRLLFVGSLDYSPNVDAVEHLAVDILPAVRRAEVHTTVVGSNPRPAVFRAARRAPSEMHVAGYVEDIRPYYESARVFVVPLRFGGGTRLKILEALAHGLPVVTTSVGCEGLELTHGEDLLVADDPGELAAAIDRLLEDDELCARLGASGREAVERRYDWREIGAAFERALRGVATDGETRIRAWS